MADYKVSDANLTSVANAIRTKGGTSASISFPNGFVTAIENIPTGGTTPKCIEGSFTGGTGETAKELTINYNGSGYPVAGIIYPKAGTSKQGDSFASLVQKNAVVMFAFVKDDIATAPTYNDTSALENKVSITSMYKNSDSDAASVGVGQVLQQAFFRNNNAAAQWSNSVRFKTATKMSVYIAETNYGFAKDIEYVYQIIYSN